MSVLVPTKFPSVAAVMLACAVSFVCLLLARILYSFMRLWSCHSLSTASNEKTPAWSSLLSLTNTWSRSLQHALPASLPFSLTIPEKPSPEVGTGAGVGLSHKRLEYLPGNWRLCRPVPQFQPPREPRISIGFCVAILTYCIIAPAVYQNPAPLSMAKLIMSRHTFRRPNPNRPRKLSTASSSRPPQPTSHLFHSIA
ncbi:uncharacterized protein BJ212DRAFT_76767 [Suillus subaureus]|uniref:Uncharacterized protein n=1 Tax=Suillus subaureus TaxID=48587 RepID=A0A9P7JFH2_9AGAM|nr:uncharacterized protein BJ212DRAFT_76767 [Suillus subaureus]KAG1819199.1 hypothetical protein BJ212DRAFT_76767 [Suillus subaureus]